MMEEEFSVGCNWKFGQVKDVRNHVDWAKSKVELVSLFERVRKAGIVARSAVVLHSWVSYGC